MESRYSSVTVTDLLMFQMGTYDLQYRRPYNLRVDDNIIGGLVERLDRSPIYTPELFSGIANTFLEPPAAAESRLLIPGNWDQQRFGFLMTVICEYRSGGKVVEYIQGYTDGCNIIQYPTNHVVDPNMSFFINSITTVRSTLEHSPGMTQAYNAVAETSHVLADNNFNGVYSQEKTQRMRPEDIFATMSRSHMRGEIVDGRSILSNQAIKSDRTNNSAMSYASTILQKYKEANQEVSEFGANEPTVLAKARGLSSEQVAGMDPFLKAITQHKGGAVGNSFTYGELLRLAPHIDNVTQIGMMDQSARMQANWAGQYADWGEANRYTQVATIISHSLAAIMLEGMFTSFTFVATNNTPGGRLAVTGPDYETYVDDPASLESRYFDVLNRAHAQVFHDVTWGNEIPFYAHCEINLRQDSKITLNLDHGGEYTYVVPSFTDSLMAPILTTNNDLAVNNAKGFDQIFTKLHESGSLGRVPHMNRAAFGRI